ncbi:MAG: hypothetical protein IKZ82_06280 [Clostridia bacterium]|nr:hypothetical protein [Clostridia bacterium]
MNTRRGVKFCPVCGGRSTIYDCRTRYNGIVRRGRRCLVCGFNYRTVELLEDDGGKENGDAQDQTQQ